MVETRKTDSNGKPKEMIEVTLGGDSMEVEKGSALHKRLIKVQEDFEVEQSAGLVNKAQMPLFNAMIEAYKALDEDARGAFTGKAIVVRFDGDKVKEIGTFLGTKVKILERMSKSNGD
jgi:hypothetical protein